MFEGKEFESKLGEYGSASVDLSDKGMLVIQAKIEVDLVVEAEKLAAKTGTPIDDQAIAWLKMLMGRAA